MLIILRLHGCFNTNSFVLNDGPNIRHGTVDCGMSGHACDGNAVVTGLDCFVVVVSIDVFSVGESVVVDDAAGPVVIAVGPGAGATVFVILRLIQSHIQYVDSFLSSPSTYFLPTICQAGGSDGPILFETTLT